VVEIVSSRPDVSLPIVGTLRPWQLVFLIVGLPGLLVATLVATVREPQRRGIPASMAGPAPGKSKALPVRAIVAYLYAERAAYAPIFVGTGLKALLAFGTSVWVPTFLQRKFGWSLGDAGVATGVILLTFAPLGLVLGGMLAERFARRGLADANWRVVLVATIAVVPFSILFPLMPTADWALAMMAVNTFLGSLGPGPQNAALQTITPNPMRGQVTALFLAVFNLIGFGLGPTFVALLTDYVLGAESLLPYSMALTSAIQGPIAVIVVWRGLKSYGESVIRARDWT
jgi:MFS family permease